MTDYDALTGDLGDLRATSGDFMAATDACLANGFLVPELAATDSLAPGEGKWFLVRTEPCGTYDSAFPSQVSGRDDGVVASGFGCN